MPSVYFFNPLYAIAVDVQGNDVKINADSTRVAPDPTGGQAQLPPQARIASNPTATTPPATCGQAAAPSPRARGRVRLGPMARRLLQPRRRQFPVRHVPRLLRPNPDPSSFPNPSLTRVRASARS
jgi:hypothetical protein